MPLLNYTVRLTALSLASVASYSNVELNLGQSSANRIVDE